MAARAELAQQKVARGAADKNCTILLYTHRRVGTIAWNLLRASSVSNLKNPRYVKNIDIHMKFSFDVRVNIARVNPATFQSLLAGQCGTRPNHLESIDPRSRHREPPPGPWTPRQVEQSRIGRAVSFPSLMCMCIVLLS